MLTEIALLALANSVLILCIFFCVWILSVVIKDSSIADIKTAYERVFPYAAQEDCVTVTCSDHCDRGKENGYRHE